MNACAQSEEYYFDASVEDSAALVKFLRDIHEGKIPAKRQRNSAYARVMDNIEAILSGNNAAVATLELLQEPVVLVLTVFVVLVFIAVWTNMPQAKPTKTE